MAWKAKFDAELAEIAGRNKSKQTNKKLTGKTTFLSINKSYRG